MRPDYRISVHDVMPETLGNVLAILDRLSEQRQASAVQLLVVPGRSWSRADIDRLRDFHDAGHELVGHGWTHAVDRFGGLYHRLHGAVISRGVAEHLATDSAGVARLIQRSFEWFERHGLPEPSYYVPPAWAMGAIKRDALSSLGFRYYEDIGGVYDAERDHYQRLPLLGYEADTALRQWLLRGSNALNRHLATRRGIVRLAIHPGDFNLRLSGDLASDLAQAAA